MSPQSHMAALQSRRAPQVFVAVANACSSGRMPLRRMVASHPSAHSALVMGALLGNTHPSQAASGPPKATKLP